MAQAVTNQYEIILNSVAYKIEGQIRPQLLSRFPPRISTGDNSFDNEQYLSNWIISDQRGGIGIEEMDESVHTDRCFWTNCLVDYSGHIRLPRLATALTLPTMPTIVDAGLEIWTNDTTLTNWSATSSGISKEATIKYAGSYSAKIIVPAGGVGSWLGIYQRLGSPTAVLGKYYTVSAMAKTSEASVVKIGITTDGTGGTTTYSPLHTGGGDWEKLTASVVIPSDATYIDVYLVIRQAGADAGKIVYFDAVTIPTLTGGTFGFCNFNSNTYMWANTCILKVNTSTGAAMTFVGDVGTAITDMQASINSRMYVAVGDSVNYWYMSTAEAFTQSNSSAYWFQQWDGKLQKFTQAGACTYSTDPDAGGPTWTAYGTISDIPSTKTRHPVVYQDAAGDDILYWATTTYLKAHDAAKTKWVDTKLKLSDHPNGAKGCLFWRDGLFLSEGLTIKKYTVGSTSTITDVGLDKDDGLIFYYNGEIVKLAEGQNEMFALLDASQASGDNYSGLYAFDGQGWSCWWADGTANQAMYDCVVSTAYGYRVYWIVGATPTVYYIDLVRGSNNPSQLSATLNYAAAGVWISPWFDAGNSTVAKCVKQIASYCKNITTSETVVIKYRTNHTNTDIATGWTTLVTLDTSGENGTVETLLGSGAGVSVDAIQLRLDLARGATTTNSPDIQAIVVSYLKTLDMKWGWNFTVVCDEAYRGNSPNALLNNLQTAANSTVLVPFLFRDNATTYTKYVKIDSFFGLHGTGHEYIGKYVVSVIEP